jgi:UDP-N-acetylmuramoyl-L-alanyl-D-glutamate--2,6-diaminopimelate ligase
MERRLSDFFTPEIAEKAGLIIREGNADPVITGLEYDSRRIKSGNLFLPCRACIPTAVFILMMQ